MYRVIKLTLILLAVWCSSAIAASDEDDVALFNAAFTSYKQYADAGDYEHAVTEAERAYGIGKRIFDEDSPNPPKLAFNYGVMLTKVRKYAMAKSVFEEALSMYESRYSDDSAELIPTLMQLGYVSAKGADSKPQRRFFDRALELAKRYFGTDSEEYGQLLLDAGRDILSKSEARDSRKYLTEAYAVLTRTSGPRDPATGLAAFNLGRLELSRNHFEDAQSYLLAALESFDDPDKPASHIEMSTHAFLVTAYQETGQTEKANAHCLAIGRMTPDNGDQEYLPLYRRAPKYPSEPLRRGMEGYVDLQFTVDEVGIVRNPVVLQTVGHLDFKLAAQAAIRSFRYAPRFRDGQPVATENVKQRLIFQIAR